MRAHETRSSGDPSGFHGLRIAAPPTARQIWHWKDNIDAGVALFTEKARQARTYPSRIRQTYPDATDFNAEQLKLETYQRYNGGAYWNWDDESRRWVKQDTTGYADECLRVEKLVSAGTPPPEWN